ncbi:MAG: aldo/keto reductase [Kiritimatiellae bacterium]|nr:aldo/keto reductase [Kiritimatiellia bacterium]
MEIRGSRIWDGRSVSDKEAETVLNGVLDAGINFIDTANDYGRSEELIGRYLSGRRDDYFLATKCGCQVTRRDEYTDDTPHVWTRANLERGLHESLSRLKTGYVDVMQLHNPTVQDCEDGKLVSVLEDMRKAGKVRWVGCSATLPDILTYIGWGVFDVFQIPYSALQREHEATIGNAAESGAGVIVRGGVARGAPGDGLGDRNRWAVFETANLDELRLSGESRTAFLLRFAISHPGISTTIVGTLNRDHLRENVESVLKGPLPPEVYTEAKRRLASAGEHDR